MGPVVHGGTWRFESCMKGGLMRLFQSLLRRWQSFFEKDSSNAELSEELQFHLERQTEVNIASGMSQEQARATAKANFGNVAQATESCYEARGVAWADDLVQDVRYGARTLAKHHSFTFITVLTLALGIGACTAIFSLVNAVLIRSLPYGDSGKLVYLFTPNPHIDLPAEVFGPSNADFFDLKSQSHSFSAMTLFDQKTYNLAVNDRVQRIGAAKVDTDFFSTLQVAPELGHAFGASEEQPGNDHVVVISDALWQSMFDGNPGILGHTLRLDGSSYQVIGIMPKDFGFPHKTDLQYGNGHIETTQIWVPSALTLQEKMNRDNSSGNAIARLKPDTTLQDAQAEMTAIMARLDPLHKGFFTGWTGLVVPFRDSILGPVRPLMWLLLGAVGFVVLIASGNAANLLLARAANRTHELGVRATLGARRGRLLRQMLTESLMLGAAAGVVGVSLAYLFLHALLKLNPGNIPHMNDATLDLHVMAFLVLVTFLTSVMFGVLPSLAATRINLAEFLNSGGMRGVVGDRRRIRDSLAIAQIALVVVLLTGAGLFLRSYINVLSVLTGFSSSTVTVNLALGAQYDTPQKEQAFFKTLLDRIKLIPGVEAVGLVNYLPLTNSESLTTICVEGYPNKKNQLVERRRITPDYLSAMQTPLLKGQGFHEEAGGPPEVLVNEAFAKTYLAGREAVGSHLSTTHNNGSTGSINTNSPWSTVIGVVEDVRNESLETAAVPQIYVPFFEPGQFSADSSAYIAVHSSLPSGAVVSEIRATVRSLDPELAISDIRTMSDSVTAATASRRFQTILLVLFSAIALFLALVGVYGLLAYSVRQKTGEIGLRMALGSSKSGVVRLVLRQGLGLLGIGLLLGLAGAFAFTRLLAGFLYDVPVLDPFTFALVPVLLFAATLAACLIPGYRAAAIDPMEALRHE
jgi:predicted permease